MPQTPLHDPDWRSLDRPALTRAYDNTGAVDDSAARLARWRARSAELRAARPDGLAIPYGVLPRNRIDLFSSGAENAPLLAFLHGGYWLRNAREDFACMAEGPLAHGIDVALIGYTLAPEASLTGIAAEIRAALLTLRARDAEAGRARRRLVVAGWSAGGHLAALASAWPEVDAGLAVSGIFDLEPLRHTALQDILGLTPAEAEALSPINRVLEGTAPVVVAYGARELPELRRQSRDYHAARLAAGRPSRLMALEDHDHFSILDALIAPDGALTLAAVELARDQVGVTSSRVSR